MKHSLLLLTAMALLAASCTEKPPSQPPPALDEQHVITVDGTSVRYNGRLFAWNKPPDEWQEVLGPRSRKNEEVSVWDDLGVFLYDNTYRYRTKDYQVASFCILFGRTRHSKITKSQPDSWPKKTFSGRLMVDGALIHKGSTVAQINSEKRGPSFREGYLRTIYHYYVDDFHISLDLGYDGTLTEFCISPPFPQDPPEAAQ